MKTETIAAIATAVSNAGISIIRISGGDAFQIIDKIYGSKNKKKRKLSEAPTHTIHYGYICDYDVTIDEVMVLIMKGPNTYTREDVVEIDCHGGVVVTKKILELVIRAGARPAEPGEFTKRAFLNGRIDLSQAEAVIGIIGAKNQYALQSSVNQLKGNIHAKIKEIRDIIIHDIAFIEAALDDPEHISLDGFAVELESHIESNVGQIEYLLKKADNGRMITEGINTVILGRPNAGKSSLMNILVGDERAIVTDIPGTTRDILQETIQLDGITLNIYDTAGIRKTEDKVEKIGVNKAMEYAEKADLIIYIIDSSETLDESDRRIMNFVKERNCIIVLNKADLKVVNDALELQMRSNKKVIVASMKEQTGLNELVQCIREMFFQGDISFNDEIYITNIRHKAALGEAAESLWQVKKSLENSLPEDFYSIDLMNAYDVLGSIIGESAGEDLINTIFAEFCMGK